MKRTIREPFIHFLLLGALLFALNAWRESKRPPQDNAVAIAVTEAVVERLRAGYERQFNRMPDEDDLRGLVTAYIREEVLSREALALGLDRDDTIVRRRLAQKMEFLTDDVVAAAEPDEAALRQFFAANAARYDRPAQISFRHVYFSRERRGAQTEAASLVALASLHSGVSDETLGDPFLQGFEFTEHEPAEISAVFGADFAKEVSAKQAGEWVGPLASSYGLHLVRVDARSEPRPVELDEVRTTVVRDFNDDLRRRTNEEIFERLKQRYQITVDEAAIVRAANPQLTAAQAGR